MTKLYKILLIIFLPAISGAQITLENYSEKYFSFDGVETGNDILQLSDGSLMACGKTGTQLFTMGLDLNGDTLFYKKYAWGVTSVHKMEWNIDGSILILAEDSTSTFFVKINEEGDSLGAIINPDLYKITLFKVLPSGNILAAKNDVAPDFPVHCCVFSIGIFNSSGSMTDTLFTNSFGIVSDLEKNSAGEYLFLTTKDALIAEGKIFVSDENGILMNTWDLHYTYHQSMDIEPGGNISCISDEGIEELNPAGNVINFFDYSPGISSYEILSMGEQGFLVTQTNTSDWILKTIRYSESGDTLFENAFGKSPNAEWISKGIPLGNNEFAYIGTSDPNGSSDPREMYFLRIKLNEPVSSLPPLTNDLIPVPSVFQNQVTFINLIIVPDLIDEIRVSDVSGRIIDIEYSLEPGKITITFPTLSNGVYHYRIVHNGIAHKGVIVHYE